MLLQSIKGFLLLLRLVPVLSWSFSAILLSAGFALHDLPSWSKRQSLIIATLLLGTLSLQGIVAHALNDHTDWKSGTDQFSKGILSGGSKVILKGYFSENQLLLMAAMGILTAIGLGIYLARLTSNQVWVFILVGIWSAISYTSRPFKLSYIPLAGEWLAAFPAMMACAIGTYYELIGRISAPIIWAAVIHSLLCVAWLMQHHLGDIDADLKATPQKLTTVAYVADRYGKQTSSYVVTAYFLLTALVSLIAAFYVHHIFAVSTISSILAAFAAWTTNPYLIENITWNQVKMIGLTVLHAIFLFGLEILI